MGKRRKRKDSGKLQRGPWDSAHITRQFVRIGYRPSKHGRHPNYEHPDREGKVQIPTNWTGVKVGQQTFQGLMVQSRLTKAQLIRVLNGLDPDE